MTAPASNMRSLQRAIDLMTILQTYQHPVRLSDLARDAELHIATVQRLLAVLVDNGFAARHGSGYTAGPAALSIAHAYLVSSPLVLIAQPIMRELSTETELTSSLYVPLGGTRVLVARVEGKNPLRYTLPVGERFPMYLGAAGKSMLAYLDSDLRSQILSGAETFKRADGIILSRTDLEADLATIRTEGIAKSTSERVLGISALAAPILDSVGTLLGSLGLSGPSDHASEDPQRHTIELRRAASVIGIRHPAAA